MRRAPPATSGVTEGTHNANYPCEWPETPINVPVIVPPGALMRADRGGTSRSRRKSFDKMQEGY